MVIHLRENCRNRFFPYTIFVYDQFVGSREILKILKRDGWVEVASVGSHLHLKHPEKKGKVTVPHPRKDLLRKTVSSIFKQAGIDM